MPLLNKRILFLLSITTIIVIGACTRDSFFDKTNDAPQHISMQMAVIKAKAWHGTEYPEASYDVLWDEAIIHRSDTAYYVEAPIRGITPPYLVARSVCEEPLRIVFKVKDRHHEARLMHIWPDREMPNASELTYADVGEYNGSISYFHTDMTPTYTLVFEKGKRKYSCLYKIKPKNTIPPSGLMQVVMFSRVLSIDDCFTEEKAQEAMEKDFSRVFYLSDELTQAWGQKCFIEGEGLDEIIITPPGGGNQPPGGNWPGDDEEDDEEYPPLPGTGNDGFEDTLPGYGGNIGGGLHIPTAYEIQIKEISEEIIDVLPSPYKDKLQQIDIEYQEGGLDDSEEHLAETEITFDENGNIIKCVIKIKDGLNDEHLRAILAHELLCHIYPSVLFSEAGASVATLNNTHPDLAACMDNTKTYDNNGKAIYNYDSAHHEWSAKNINILITLLKCIFPYECEDYYYNISWGGGLHNTQVFNDCTIIPFDKQHEVIIFLKYKGLLK